MLCAADATCTSTGSGSTRITTVGPWARPDGVLVATSEPDLIDGTLLAAMVVDETRAYVAGDTAVGHAWTGTFASGSSSAFTCSS